MFNVVAARLRDVGARRAGGGGGGAALAPLHLGGRSVGASTHASIPRWSSLPRHPSRQPTSRGAGPGLHTAFGHLLRTSASTMAGAKVASGVSAHNTPLPHHPAQPHEEIDLVQQHGAASVTPPRRGGPATVMTKAKRIRLAAAASLAAEHLQQACSPAAAVVHSQRVQQLRREEELINASLQRLKAERELCTAHLKCEEDLERIADGVMRTCTSTTITPTTTSFVMEEESMTAAEVMGQPTPSPAANEHDAALLELHATADAEAASARQRPGHRRQRQKPSLASRTRTVQKRIKESTKPPRSSKSTNNVRKLSKRTTRQQRAGGGRHTTTRSARASSTRKATPAPRRHAKRR